MSERVRASALRYAPELKVSLLDYAQWVSACMTLEFSVAPGSAPDVQGRGVGQDQGAAVQDAVGRRAAHSVARVDVPCQVEERVWWCHMQ